MFETNAREKDPFVGGVNAADGIRELPGVPYRAPVCNVEWERAADPNISCEFGPVIFGWNADCPGAGKGGAGSGGRFEGTSGTGVAGDECGFDIDGFPVAGVPAEEPPELFAGEVFG
ncbi:MAG: hypothetical protein KDB01_21740 [Planctomycetaceae bacterium]|nr:hypothetical protein [Planctomycetaceae bacterium]